MQASQKLVDFVTAEEGSVSRAYRDPVGIITIGVGHTSAAGGLQVKMGMELSPLEISALLRTDLEKFIARVDKAMPSAEWYEREGGASFDFNTGAIFKASWVEYMFRPGQEAIVERRIKLWNKAGGKVLRGLTTRRAREADIILHNKWPDAERQFNIPPSASPQSDYILQLVKLGYLEKGATISPAVTEAVKQFQTDKGLVSDGIVGPATRATLHRALATKATTNASAGTATTGGLGSVGSVQFLEGAGSSSIVLVGLAIAAAILIGGWVWRNRGRLFGIPAQTISTGEI